MPSTVLWRMIGVQAQPVAGEKKTNCKALCTDTSSASLAFRLVDTTMHFFLGQHVESKIYKNIQTIAQTAI